MKLGLTDAGRDRKRDMKNIQERNPREKGSSFVRVKRQFKFLKSNRESSNKFQQLHELGVILYRRKPIGDEISIKIEEKFQTRINRP